jgi:fatty-acyl-CoA synthase
VLLENISFDPHEAWRLVERERVTQLVIVGDAIAKPLLNALISAEAEGKPYDVSSLRLIASAGVMWTREVKEGLLHYADLKLIDFFGSSEGGMGMSVATRTQMPQTAQFLARPNTKLLDEDGKEIPRGSPQVGRLAATGNIPYGYYKDPEKSARTFLHFDNVRYSVPGDYATIDANGRITVLGRGSGCINTGGEKVFAEEVEEVLKRHNDVYDCLVVGIPDTRFGQAVAALVSPTPGTRPDPETLRVYVRKHLSGYKVPKKVRVVDEVRRAPNGKADYEWAKAEALLESAAACT